MQDDKTDNTPERVTPVNMRLFSDRVKQIIRLSEEIAEIERTTKLTEKLANEQMKGALRFKELMIEASNPLLHAHIEGVFAVYQTRTSHDTE